MAFLKKAILRDEKRMKDISEVIQKLEENKVDLGENSNQEGHIYPEEMVKKNSRPSHGGIHGLNNNHGANGKNNPGKNKIGGHENEHAVNEALDERKYKGDRSSILATVSLRSKVFLQFRV